MKGFWTLVWTALASSGFAIRFGLGAKDLPLAMGGAVAGWLVYAGVSGLTAPAQGYFAAALFIGLFAEIFAASLKKPATIYIVTAIFPLVPGSGMYYTMLYSVRGELWNSISSGFETLTAAGAIAAGLAVSSGLSRLISLRSLARRISATPRRNAAEAGPRPDAVERSNFESLTDGSGWHD